jgi:hypothetical protein
LIGDFYNPSLYTTTGVTVNSGVTTTIYGIPTSAYTGAYFDYNVKSTDGLRSGNIMAIWSGSTVNFTETSTNDIGNTSQVTMSVDLSGANVRLKATTTTQWTIRSLVRLV